ncbi:MAG: hypothetical protein IBX72_14735 [Nitrospirae bacterium]|nr:hypothetical protein [Nitrospirota bacterium]
MPTNRKRSMRTKLTHAGITEADYMYYSWGSFFDAEGYENGKTEEELKAFWIAHRDVIMARFMTKAKQQRHRSKRPWPFWKYDITEQRLPVNVVLKSNELYNPEEVHNGFEADYAFLRRLGLLEDWEQNS